MISESPTLIAHRVMSILGNNGQYGGGGALALEYVADAVASSRGDHLEIGSLYGATAMAAAEAMRGQPRSVVCVDPFDDALQETCLAPERRDGVLKAFRANIKPYKERIEHVRKRSQPWPDELEGREFGSALIDGFHYGETPLLDAMACADCVTTYILLDDIQEDYVDVFDAFLWLCQSPKWFLEGMRWRTALFRRRRAFTPNPWDPRK